MKLISRATTALSAVAALALIGCPPPDENGEELPDIEELFPADNEVGSWVEDTSTGTAGVEVARTYDEAWELVDGDADSFEEVVDNISQLGEEAASRDVRLGIKPHVNQAVYNTETALAFMQRVDTSRIGLR